MAANVKGAAVETTLFDIASGIKRPPAGKKATKASPPITEGLTPEPLGKLREGIHELTPAQALSLRVPLLGVDGGVEGYQRDARKTQAHVRRLAESIERGVLIPTATVACHEGHYYLTDGGHRGLAAVMTDTLFRVEVRPLTPQQQRELFHHQSYAKKLKREHAVLTGDSPLALYVQDAFTAPESPWDGLLAPLYSLQHGGAPGGSITPAGLELLAGTYGRGLTGMNTSTVRTRTSKEPEFDAKAADELAGLLRAFGTAKTNPLAWKAMSLRAIAGAAVMVLRRPERQAGDVKRWMTHMGTFDFSQWQHLRGAHLLRDELVRHWNKRLSADRRVKV